MKFPKRIIFPLLIIFAPLFLNAQSTSIKSYMFGHSLMDHRPPLIPTPSDETTIAHWIHLLATDAGNTYEAAGQYGFLPQHDNLPPTAQWGYDIVTPAWDSDVESFSEANFNNALITAGNFMQWQAPDLEYPTDPGVSPISATQTIVEWLSSNEPSINIYIYENWPDMSPYISNGTFPPTESDLDNYYNYLEGDFHDWWLEYHDALLLSHPDEEVKMIPVGPILSDLLTNTVLNTIPTTELYEDDAPHGRATLYFLAGMITYMAIFEEQTPLDYTVPDIIHTTVADNYNLVVNHIWDELIAFTLPNGDSRVFSNNVILPVDLVEFKGEQANNNIQLTWTTSNESNNKKFEIEHSEDGLSFRKIGEVDGNNTTTITQKYSFEHSAVKYNRNYYRLKQIDFDGHFEYSTTIYLELNNRLTSPIQFFPNPSPTGEITLDYTAYISSVLNIQVFDITGRFMMQESRNITEGENRFNFDFSELKQGIFIIKTQVGQDQFFRKIIIDASR